MQTIGFVGVGRIGTEISKHLLAAGYEVFGYRRSSTAEFEKIGGTSAASPADVGERADIVFSCLPGGDALDEVVNGPRGLVHSARPGQIIVELGSHALPVKQRQIDRLAQKGAAFLDGEVSGTPGMVAQRKAPIYLAGDPDACQKIEPIVKSFSELCLYFGPFGAASKSKFINNLLVTVNTAAIGEAVALALKAGVDPELMIKAISTGSGGSVLFPIRAPRMVKKRLSAGARHIRRPVALFRLHRRSRRQYGKRDAAVFPWRPSCSGAASRTGLAEHDVAAIIEVVNQIPSAGEAPHDCDANRRFAGALFRPLQHRPIARHRSRQLHRDSVRMIRQRRHGTPSRTWGSISFTPIARAATTSRAMGSMRTRWSTHRASRARSITFPTCCAARAICSSPNND